VGGEELTSVAAGLAEMAASGAAAELDGAIDRPARAWSGR